MNALIILADLGRVKAYRITCDELDPRESPAFEDLADVDLVNRHSKVSERVTDKAGRFAYGPGSISVGESHHEQEAAESQQLQRVAAVIDEVAGRNRTEIHLSAPREIIGELTGALRPGVLKRIRKQLPLNLVKQPKLELLERFGLR